MESTRIMGRRLGRIAKTPYVRGKMLRLAEYITTPPDAMPPPPTVSIWGQKNTQPWGMMGNDVLGDCTCAACGHGIQVLTGTASDFSAETSPSTTAIETMYRASGWNPADPNTDQGWLIGDALEYWRVSGILGPGGVTHKIAGWLQLDISNQTEMMTAAYLFGGINFGLQLPLSAQSQSYWAVMPNAGATGQAGSWGGHSVWSTGYDQNQTWRVISWGMWMRMSKRFQLAYVDEAYCVVSEDWIANTGFSPSGFAYSQLLADIYSMPKTAYNFRQHLSRSV